MGAIQLRNQTALDTSPLDTELATQYDPAIVEAALMLSSMGYTDRQVQKMTGVDHTQVCRWRNATEPAEFKRMGDVIRKQIEGTSKGIVATIIEAYSEMLPVIIERAGRELETGSAKAAKDLIVMMAMMHDKAVLGAGLARRNDPGALARDARMQQTNIQIVMPDNGRTASKTEFVDAAYTVGERR
jgi:hypothetical protein